MKKKNLNVSVFLFFALLGTSLFSFDISETITVPSGSFDVGGNPPAHTWPLPIHQITFTHDMELGKYTVTNRNYADMLNYAMDEGLIEVNSGDFVINLEGVSDHQDNIQLYAGWNFLPILSPCQFTPFDVLVALDEALVQIKEIAGTKVYWPAKQVGTLEVLIPGRAYFILLNQDAVLYFEDCGRDEGETERWGDMTKPDRVRP